MSRFLREMNRKIPSRCQGCDGCCDTIELVIFGLCFGLSSVSSLLSLFCLLLAWRSPSRIRTLRRSVNSLPYPSSLSPPPSCVHISTSLTHMHAFFFCRWAKEVMNLIELEPGLPMRSVFSFSEIYTGSKVRHFTQIRKNSGVPYEDMIFFDDWDQNCKDVGSLGVVCIECRRVRRRERERATYA